MLTTTQPADLRTEIQAIMAVVDHLTDKATYMADETHDRLFCSDGVAATLSTLPKVKEADGMPGPVEEVLGTLEDVKRVTDIGAELDAVGSEVYGRLMRMGELLGQV
jgi:hypothetical protein